MMEKLCIFCKNCQWMNDRGYCSTWTGEYGTSGFTCRKLHFSAYGAGGDGNFEKIEDVRTLFLRAEKCSDYEPDK